MSKKSVKPKTKPETKPITNGKKLVIVESPAKAKTLEKFLGKGFEVKASGGHVRDLPAKRLGVDVKNNFEPTYVTIPGKNKIITALKDAAKDAEIVFLAPDPDREGEAIAWHLAHALGKKTVIKRIEFHEITKDAVTKAVLNPREINLNRVNAQQTRRILDRLVGYKLSPLLWKKIRKGLSAGRVQSVAVRLICEREKEIRAFVPVEFWSITVNLSPEKEAFPFESKFFSKNGEKIEIGNEATAKQILSDLEGAPFIVSEINKKEQKKNPPAPFITSSLQQEAARKFGFSTKKTMMVAQTLYEGVETEEGRIGLISYMRTDSVRIAQEALDQVRELIAKDFGTQYLPAAPRQYKSRKQAQDAHEAIRPTSVARTPEKMQQYLTEDQAKLYSLIWKRFVACQMQEALYDQTTVNIAAKEYIFRTTGRTLKFDGFTKLYFESSDTPEAEEAEKLPVLEEKELLKLLGIIPKQHFTEPPPRYNEASLVKEMEEKGIGRPSTYAPIISTIVDRGYVEKEGRMLKPTNLGMLTNEQLTDYFPTIMDITFTAKMEDELDDIAEGKLNWLETLREFYEPFEKSLLAAETAMPTIKQEEVLEEKCPKCGKNLVIRVGRFGRFIACEGYPGCKYTRQIEPQAEESKEVCDKCGKPMVVKHSRFGSFLACSGYPDCKNIKSINKDTGVACPKCDGKLVERKSKRGKVFYSCSNYPKCVFALWNRPVAEKCPTCGSILVEKFSKVKGKTIKCSNEECDFEKGEANA
ncbi:MAG: type I DNA topoisomerase [Candidatus Saganbacteria bacterium]|nr:type I DNA topoisomerase [Candidatus Saganbacteria bacterium]